MEDERGRLCWDAESFYQPQPSLPYAIIVLNRSLNKENLNMFVSLWQRANIRMCVDGATNAYHKIATNSDGIFDSIVTKNEIANPSSNGSTSLELPHIISGDFDSVHPELLTYYGRLGVDIISTPDQNETDFTKGVTELGKYVVSKNVDIKHVLVFASINSERFDHIIANLATLYKVENHIPAPVVMVSGGSLFWLLDTGDHVIKVPPELILNPERSWCGLAPFGHPATVTTKGLNWNLDNKVLGFGHMVSTSNTYDPTHEGKVSVTTCQPLLWMMGWDIDAHYPANDKESSFASNICSKLSILNLSNSPTSSCEVEHLGVIEKQTS